jgi:hypothetical protein
MVGVRAVGRGLALGVAAFAISLGALPGVTTAATVRTCPRGSVHTVYAGEHRCLSVGERRLIFWELVRWQDRHPGQDVRAYAVIAKRWRIAVATAWKIAYEGASKNWPMPPPP